jgi:hypothetical protein
MSAHPSRVMYVYKHTKDASKAPPAEFVARCDRLAQNDPTLERIDAVSLPNPKKSIPNFAQVQQSYNSLTEDEMLSAIGSIERATLSGLCICHYRGLFSYGLPLGRALQSNTVVNHIDFDPNLFSTNGTFQADEAAPMLEFLRTGTSLRTIGLAVDPSIEEEIQDEYDFSKPSLQGEILRAVAQNSHVMTFASSVELPQQEFCQFLTSPTLAIKTLRLDGYALDAFEDTTLLVDAFGTNRSLQELFFCTALKHQES